MMSNPIPKSSLFATPESLEDLDRRIRLLPTASERAVAYQFTIMAFNLACRLVEEEDVVQ